MNRLRISDSAHPYGQIWDLRRYIACALENVVCLNEARGAHSVGAPPLNGVSTMLGVSTSITKDALGSHPLEIAETAPGRYTGYAPESSSDFPAALSKRPRKRRGPSVTLSFFALAKSRADP
jgi:hypothetical protein